MLLSWHVFVVRMMCLCCFHLSIMHFGHALPVTSVLQPIHLDIVCVFKARLCVWWKRSICLSHRFVFWDRDSWGRGAAGPEIVSSLYLRGLGYRCVPPLVVHLHFWRNDFRLEWKPGGGGACLGRQLPFCLQSEFQDSQCCQSCLTEKPCLRNTNKGLEWKPLVAVLCRSQRVVVISRRGSQSGGHPPKGDRLAARGVEEQRSAARPFKHRL